MTRRGGIFSEQSGDLIARPTPPSVITSWGGDCNAGNFPTYGFNIQQDTDCTVTFSLVAGQLVDIPAVNCNPVAPVCNPPFVHNFTGAANNVQIVYSAPSNHCGAIKIEVTLDGTLKLTSNAVDPNGNTGNLDLGAVAAGNHALSLRAVGVPGGCIPASGNVTAWQGTLFVSLL